MVSALLIILCLYLILFYVLPWLLRMLRRHAMRKFAAGLGIDIDSMDTGHKQTAGRQDKRRDTATYRKKKKIDPDMGEYVAFEEIKVTSSHKTTAYDASSTYNESQIVDAEWEEIRN